MKNSKQTKQTIDALYQKLLKVDKFKNFVQFNRIDNVTIKSAIRAFEYEYYKPGTQLFQEGENSSKFFGIIKGKISFRVKRRNGTEVEKFQFGNGMCFGEWAALYDRKRSTSAYVLEESHLFSLEKETFKAILGKTLLKAEGDRKDFLCKTISYFQSCYGYKVDDIIRKNIFPEFYKRGEIIYQEGEATGSLYLIYMGEGVLMKDISSPHETIVFDLSESTSSILYRLGNFTYDDYFKRVLPVVKDEEEKKHLINLRDLSVVMKLSEGGIGGMEACACVDRMRYTLVSNSDFTAVLRFDLRSSQTETRSEMLKSLLPVFIDKEKIIEDNISRIKFVDEKTNQKIKKKHKTVQQIIEAAVFDCSNNGTLLDKLSKKLVLNSAGFIKVCEENKKIFTEKENLSNQNKQNLEFSNKIKELLAMRSQPKKDLKKSVKLLKCMSSKSPLSMRKYCPKGSTGSFYNFLTSLPYPSVGHGGYESAKTSKNPSGASMNFSIDNLRKGQKGQEQIIRMLNQIIEKKMNDGELFLGKSSSQSRLIIEKKAELPKFENILRRNKSSADISKMDFKNNKFLEGNYRFGEYFHRHLDSAKLVYIGNEAKTVYNSGSFDLPFVSELSKNNCH